MAIALAKFRSTRLQTYNLVFSLTVAVSLALMGLAYTFLVRTGETISPAAAAQRQQTENVIFGSALFFRPVPYKIALYGLRRPDVAIVGSSRAIEFVGRGFSRPMTNLGSMRDLGQIRQLLESMLSVHRPKLILLTVDFWWFNGARSVDTVGVQPDGDARLSLLQLLKPFVWIAQGKIGLGDFLAGALSPWYRPAGIGVAASFDHVGYDPDGAYDYGGELTGKRRHRDPRFATTLAHIEEASAHNKFNVHTAMDEAQWSSLVDIVHLVRASGAELILVLPPVSKTVADRLAAGGAPNLLTLMNARLPALGVPVFDFHDPTAIGSSECEFIDGFHGGRVTYLRMLDAIARSGRTSLGNFVDLETIDRLIAGNVGRATFREDERAGEPETDFLDLGCKK